MACVIDIVTISDLLSDPNLDRYSDIEDIDIVFVITIISTDKLLLNFWTVLYLLPLY